VARSISWPSTIGTASAQTGSRAGPADAPGQQVRRAARIGPGRWPGTGACANLPERVRKTRRGVIPNVMPGRCWVTRALPPRGRLGWWLRGGPSPGHRGPSTRVVPTVATPTRGSTSSRECERRRGCGVLRRSSARAGYRVLRRHQTPAASSRQRAVARPSTPARSVTLPRPDLGQDTPRASRAAGADVNGGRDQLRVGAAATPALPLPNGTDIAVRRVRLAMVRRNRPDPAVVDRAGTRR
jgi:hypothetical protein